VAVYSLYISWWPFSVSKGGDGESDLSVALDNGTLQNGNVTTRYMLQNGTRYKTVRVTKWYALQNGTRYKTVTLQNSTCYKMGTCFKMGTCYKTVHVTKRYIFILCYEGTNPGISWVFALT
jgi:hypothetical protein